MAYVTLGAASMGSYLLTGQPDETDQLDERIQIWLVVRPLNFFGVPKAINPFVPLST